MYGVVVIHTIFCFFFLQCISFSHSRIISRKCAVECCERTHHTTPRRLSPNQHQEQFLIWFDGFSVSLHLSRISHFSRVFSSLFIPSIRMRVIATTTTTNTTITLISREFVAEKLSFLLAFWILDSFCSTVVYTLSVCECVFALFDGYISVDEWIRIHFISFIHLFHLCVHGMRAGLPLKLNLSIPFNMTAIRLPPHLPSLISICVYKIGYFYFSLPHFCYCTEKPKWNILYWKRIIENACKWILHTHRHRDTHNEK